MHGDGPKNVSLTWTPKDVTHHHHASTSVGECETELEQRAKHQEELWRDDLLKWLVFARIHDRREQVKKPHERTFRWIFERDHTTGFADWLQSDEDVYWISGKPASGKSTLMKYITQTLRKRKDLRSRAHGSVVLASFWLWAIGSELQRTLVGLYRSLLYEILRQDQRMCRIAFPFWEREFSDTPPTLPSLRAAMDSVLETDEMSTSFLFLIDGLDEYDSDGVGKTELAEIVLGMARSSKIKIVVSSRPETSFENSFRCYKKLRLQDLTKGDIANFVESRLISNPSLRQLTLSEEHRLLDIAAYIRQHARGVFLWVALICKIVVDSVNNYENTKMIHDRIDEIPLELDDLFTHVLTVRVPRRYRTETLRYLLMTLHWKNLECSPMRYEEVTSEVLFLGQQASDYEAACRVSRIDPDQYREAVATGRDYIRARCHGLLESAEDELSPVPWAKPKSSTALMFLHRSLFDYLNKQEAKNDLFESVLDERFDPSLALVSAIGACLINCDKFSGYTSMDPNIKKLFYLNAKAEASTGSSLFDLLTYIDRRLQQKFLQTRDRLWDEIVHWTYRLDGIGDPTQDYSPNSYPRGLYPSLLSTVLETGGILFLEDAIKRPGAITTQEATKTLGFQVHYDSFNVRAIEVLLQHGAEPLGIIQGCDLSPWRILLNKIVSHWQQHNNAECLEVVRLLAFHSRDRKRCRLMKHSDGKHTMPSLIREQFLSAPCCSGKSWKDCDCAEARRNRAAAMAALQLLDGKSSITSKITKTWKLKATFLRDT